MTERQQRIREKFVKGAILTASYTCMATSVIVIVLTGIFMALGG